MKDNRVFMDGSILHVGREGVENSERQTQQALGRIFA